MIFAHRKNSLVFRLVVAAVFATLACVGLAAAVSGAVVLFGVPLLLLIRRGGFTRPIPRSERWGTFLMIGIFWR